MSRLRKRIRLDRALSENEVAAAGPDAKRLPADTTYLTVAHNGMMVSLIQSVCASPLLTQRGTAKAVAAQNFRGFGSGVVLPDTGFMLQNRGELFSLHDGHPNVYAPRKRPFHTIIPAFAQLGDGSLLSFGLMGGDMQAQGHAQMMHGKTAAPSSAAHVGALTFRLQRWWTVALMCSRPAMRRGGITATACCIWRAHYWATRPCATVCAGAAIRWRPAHRARLADIRPFGSIATESTGPGPICAKTAAAWRSELLFVFFTCASKS